MLVVTNKTHTFLCNIENVANLKISDSPPQQFGGICSRYLGEWKNMVTLGTPDPQNDVYISAYHEGELVGHVHREINQLYLSGDNVSVLYVASGVIVSLRTYRNVSSGRSVYCDHVQFTLDHILNVPVGIAPTNEIKHAFLEKYQPKHLSDLWDLLKTIAIHTPEKTWVGLVLV